jgi:acetylornithine/N-succinyldiaminopimelate aminotransferase
MKLSHLLEASALLSDPRVTQGKSLIMSALKNTCAKLTAIAPPRAELRVGYKEAIERLSKMRSANLWYNYLGSGIGNGALVELCDGSVKYDFITGIGVHFFGHSHPKLVESCVDASLCDIIVQGHLQQNCESLELISKLTSLSHLPHCFLTTSGSMAVENSIKIALQKQFPAQRLLAFERCFSGRTLMLAQTSDKPHLRDMLPSSYPVDYIPFFDAHDPEGSTKAAVAALRKIIQRYPKQHALMLFELIQGEGGCYTGSKGFFLALMNILQEHNIAIVIDEVQTFGRTPEMFAFQYYELDKYVDICAIGKLSLVCATLFSERFAPRPGLLGQTFTSTSASIRCSIDILEMLLEGGFYGNQGKIARMGAYFTKKLTEISTRHPGLISGPFGVGGMVAFTPYGGNKEAVISFLHRLFDAGVMAFSAGQNPMRVRFLPPMAVITENDIDQVMEIVERTLLEEGSHAHH